MTQPTHPIFSLSNVQSVFEHCNASLVLPHLGVIECIGEDCTQFLNHQLTQDVLSLPKQSATLAAFCNAKGRIQASFYLFKGEANHCLLILPKDLLAQTLKRLSMFVLRSKVKLQDASHEYAVLGLVGDRANAFLSEHSKSQAKPPQLALEAFQTGTFQSNQTLPEWSTIHPALGLSRVIICAKSEHVDISLLSNDQDSNLLAWKLGEVLSGVPLIGASAFEHYVPQMLNYESVGAVSFKKGCYPGQEIVARSQFRGTLKRRTAIVFSPIALQPNQAVYSQECALDQAQGEIIQSVQWGEITFATACLQLQIFDTDPSLKDPAWEQLKSPTWTQALKAYDDKGDVHELGLMPLPYLLMKDI